MQARPDARIMFEIYREAEPPRHYRVVYFTELDEHQREEEIERAMAGEHVFDGFISEHEPRAKENIAALVDQLNRGEPPDPVRIETRLSGLLC